MADLERLDGRPFLTQLCPRCQGQRYDKGACGLCENTGLLDEYGDPWHPPPPMDGWAPERIVAQDRAWRNRGQRGG